MDGISLLEVELQEVVSSPCLAPARCVSTDLRGNPTPRVMMPSKRSSTGHYVASLPKVTYNTGLQPWDLLRDRNEDYSLLSAPLT